jgi:hypothetical protein
MMNVGEQDEEQAEPVDAHAVGDAPRGDPGDLLHELEAGLADLERDEHEQRERRTSARPASATAADRGPRRRGQQRDDERGERGQAMSRVSSGIPASLAHPPKDGCR